jgi:hypothetical protein
MLAKERLVSKEGECGAYETDTRVAYELLYQLKACK